MAYHLTGTLKAPLLPTQFIKYRRSRYTESSDVLDLLKEALTHDPTDIHVVCGQPVLLEVHGQLKRITDHALEWNEFESFARVLRDKEGATTLLSQGQDYDDAFSLTDAQGARRRLRINMTATKSVRHNPSAGLVLRPMMDIPPTVESLGLPKDMLDKCYPKDGAVYVIGPTGSGKTTLFGSLIRHAAETGCAWHGHFACYEDPPEFDLEGLSSEHLLITQCAINSPWGLPSFAQGARNGMRRHPCAVMIGEVRDYETVSATVELALTGHPVLATTHAANPAVAFQRLVTRYPFEQQRAGMYDLIMTTKLVIAQRLLPSTDGKRIAVREWIAFDDGLRHELLNKGDVASVVSTIANVVRTSGNSFKAAASDLLARGLIAKDVAQQFD